ncbi:MmgE/PrpD family protein [Salisediminibacterium beveridgei]|uniref:2-methylcitrate dehydratase PrpD n=1 Tax=Salisediminibacterium beveridgei TaxID=632773 RepID=A0A1D7QS79_9BACI|nr:MmgE/PrpD family protein [Salisediminibacterium beveridgei]AOM81849.1 hypothetical protein BBEV_0455 [Salisediminibacterium beveridgei]
MISKTIASYVKQLDLSDVPEDVVKQAKRLLLDTLSTTVRGKCSEEAEILRQVVPQLGGGGNCTVILENRTYPPPQAALMNAVMAHAYELDDTDRRTFYHAGAPVISAALAAAEDRNASGKQLLEGILAGYEVSVRIADAVNPSHRTRGFHTTGTVGTFGAGIAAAKIFGLSEQEFQYTLGHSGTQAAGLFEFLNDGSMTKRLHPGKAAWNGVFAAQLAEGGMTGPVTILEGRHGFLNVTADKTDPAMLTDRLGEDYRIQRIGIKRHAACRYAHTPIDAALDLQREKSLDVERIRSVNIKMSERNFSQTGKATASTLVAAQLSSPYAVAVALVNRTANIDAYEHGLEDPAVLKLMNKITTEAHEPYGDFSRTATLEVKMKDGTLHEKTAELPKGEPEEPLSEEELLQKVTELMRTGMEQDAISAVVETVGRLEQLDTLRPLMGHFGAMSRMGGI